jgi:hypothetical protein
MGLNTGRGELFMGLNTGRGELLMGLGTGRGVVLMYYSHSHTGRGFYTPPHRAPDTRPGPGGCSTGVQFV